MLDSDKTMIIYTNEGNPFGLELLILAKVAKKDVTVKTVNLNGEWIVMFFEILFWESRSHFGRIEFERKIY